MTDYRADLAAIFPERYQKHLRLYELEAGDVICHQGDKLGALCYILEGQIKVVRRLYKGREHILDTKTAPALIGEIELLTQQKNVSSVVTLTKVTIAKLPLAHLEDDLLNDASFLLNIGKELAQALYQQNIRSTTNITYTLKERLATHILKYAEDDRFRPERTRLAESFGVSYRHVSRVLQQLTKDGILEKDKPYYSIKDKKALKKLQITD